MSVSKGEIAALNAVLKDLRVYEQFIEGKGCTEYKGCTFGDGGEVKVYNGQVVELNYNTSDPSLKGKDSFLSIEIGNLSNLTRLGLFGYKGAGYAAGYLSGNIPSEIGKLNLLHNLALYNNDLSGLIPTEIGNLSQLNNRGLDLSNNKLQGSIPTEIGNIKVLEALYLNNNKLQGSIPTEIGNLKALEHLDLNTNNLSGSIPTEIGNLSPLWSLALNNNDLSGSIPTGIGNLSQLFSLYLNNNELSGSIPTEIGNMSNVSALGLNNNDLSGLIPTEIGNLRYLAYLVLNNNCLSIDSNVSETIKSLDLYNNPPHTKFTVNNNCIAIDALNTVTEPNCKHCGNCPTVLPSICTSNIDDILFPVLPDPEPNPKPKPKPKYRTVYNNRTGCFTICKKK